MGFLIARGAIMAPPPADLDGDRVAALLHLRKLQGTGSEPTKVVDELQLVILGHDVEEFRDGAVALSVTKAMSELPQVAPGALQDFVKGEVSVRFPFIWSYVMAGSFIVMGDTLADNPVVAFYNPYFDVAILTKWSLTGQTAPDTKPGFKIIEAVPSTGRAFLENRASLATDTHISDNPMTPLQVRIVKGAAGFVEAFEKRYPPMGRESAAFSTDAAATGVAVALIEKRVLYLLTWLADAQDSGATVNYAAEITQLRSALSASSPAKLEALLPKDNPQAAGTFFQLQPNIRRGMKPYMVIEKNVIFLDPVNLPTAFISLDLKPAAKGYTPALVSLFNLEASYPGR
jgi:hypothetical protein